MNPNKSTVITREAAISRDDALTEDVSAAPETAAAREAVSSQTPSPPSEKKRMKAPVSQAVQLVVRIAATLLIIWLLLAFVSGIYVCHSDACSPAVKDGDLCVTWQLSELSAGDLIVYDLNGEAKFGRVIAAAGDRVEIKDSYVWVNGYIALQEPLPAFSSEKASVRFPYVVPEKSVFVICPNAFEEDSRANGAFPIGDCRGKVVFLMRRRGI